MKLIFRLSAFILLATMLLSCDDDNIEQKLDPGIEITDELVVGPTASRNVIMLKSTYPWYAESSVSWIKMVRYRGQYLKPDSIVMEVQENPNMDLREGWIEVRLMDQMSTKVHVIQNGRGSLITLSKEKIIFNKNGGEAVIDVATKVEWEPVTEGLEGVTATKLSESQLKVAVSPNNTGNEITRELIVRSADGTTESRLTIVQANVENILSIPLNAEDKDVLLEKAGEELVIPVSLNVNYQCMASDDWISILEAPTFEGDIVQDINIKVSVSQNAGIEERWGYVCVKSSDETATDTLFISQKARSQRVYVKAGVSGGDGTSWERAFGTVEDGVAACSNYGDMDLWIAEGEYVLKDYLTLKRGINVYGGFAGNETKLKDRDMSKKSVLKAAPANTWSSIYAYDQTDECYVDGFVFTGSVSSQGLGTIEAYDNWVFRNCIITGNNTTRDAGGYFSKCKLYNCLIYGNSTINNSSTVNSQGSKIYNTTIVNNTSGGSSSGLRAGAGTEVYNTVIWNNKHTNGENNNGYLDAQGSCSFKNCAIEGSLSFNNAPSSTDGSIILGSENMAADGPNFVSPENGDYSLLVTSPLIDKGAEWTDFNLYFDILGHDRSWNGHIDIGAYEYIGK